MATRVEGRAHNHEMASTVVHKEAGPTLSALIGPDTNVSSKMTQIAISELFSK